MHGRCNGGGGRGEADAPVPGRQRMDPHLLIMLPQVRVFFSLFFGRSVCVAGKGLSVRKGGRVEGGWLWGGGSCLCAKI
jgi:hypothetical protein